MKKRDLFLTFFSIILLFSIIWVSMRARAHPDQEIKNPSLQYEIVGGWIASPYAYESDDLRTHTGVTTHDPIHGFRGYGFDLPSNTTIESVEVGMEGYVTNLGDYIYWAISWDGGSTWSSEDSTMQTSEALLWYNVTGATEWNIEKLNNTNLHAKIRGHTVVTGCYHPDGEVSMWEDKTSLFEMKMKKISEVKKGDILLGFDLENQVYIKNIMLEDANITKGKFTFYRIIAEHKMELWDKEIYSWDKPDERGYKDICVTGEQGIYTVEKGKIPAEDVEIGMHFHGLFRKDGILSIVPIQIIKIEKFEYYVAVTLEGTSEVIFSHYILGKAGKSCHVDWLPIKVIYTPPEVPPEVSIPVLFVGILFVTSVSTAILILGVKHRK